MNDTENQLLREALHKIKHEAVSLADAQVIALEALTQPAEAGEVLEVEDLLVWAVEDGVIRMSKVMDADLQDALVKYARRFTTPPASQEQADTQAVDKAWGRLAIAMGDAPGSPYPGMAKAFEEHFGQSWVDKDWRNEQSVWAAAWRKAWDAHAQRASQEQAQQPHVGDINAVESVTSVRQPVKEHEKDCAACANQNLPASVPVCQQCNCLATGARRNWEAKQSSGGEVAFQGGLSNKELLEAWQRKVPGVHPHDRMLAAFALGVEVGAEGLRIAAATHSGSGEQAEHWGALAQQKADADMKRGVTMPVSYYVSTVVGALLSSQKLATKPEPMTDGDIEAIAKTVRPIVETGQPSWEHAVIRAYEQARGITSTSTKGPQ